METTLWVSLFGNNDDIGLKCEEPPMCERPVAMGWQALD